VESLPDDIHRHYKEEHHAHTETIPLLLPSGIIIVRQGTSLETCYWSGYFETGGQQRGQRSLGLEKQTQGESGDEDEVQAVGGVQAD